MTVFAHSQTTNKLVNEAANDSARVSGQDRKIPPALGTNQIGGFGGFRPLASLEKNRCIWVKYDAFLIFLKKMSFLTISKHLTTPFIVLFCLFFHVLFSS